MAKKKVSYPVQDFANPDCRTTAQMAWVPAESVHAGSFAGMVWLLAVGCQYVKECFLGHEKDEGLKVLISRHQCTRLKHTMGSEETEFL